MIKIDVISGFLGAGKTTLIKKLFESKFHDEKIVLIENEFGEIGIDGSFLKESGVSIKEINSGCICCSLVGDFSTSMKEVVDRFNPDRIIVEPSGVGKLSDIINAVKKVDLPFEINILATVVDGPKVKVYLKNFGEFFLNQVDSADTIIINKIDKMDEEKLLEVVELVKEKNPHAAIITTPIKDLDPVKLLEILEKNVSLKDELLHSMEEDDDDEEECCCHHHHHDEDDDDDEECCHHHHHHDDDDDDDEECCCHHHHDDDDDDDEECCHHNHHHDEDDDDDEECCCHHHEGEEHHHHHHHGHDADEIFDSIGIETAQSISKPELEKFLNTLATDESLGIIVRSKGILKASDQDEWYYFDFVSGDYEIRNGAPDYTGRLCVIGSKMDINKIKDLFARR